MFVFSVTYVFDFDKQGQMDVIVKTLFDEATLKEYFSLMAESPKLIVNQTKVEHLIHILSVNGRWWKSLDRQDPKGYKENDAYWLFLSAVAKYYETLASTDDEGKLTFKE